MPPCSFWVILGEVLACSTTPSRWPSCSGLLTSLLFKVCLSDTRHRQRTTFTFESFQTPRLFLKSQAILEFAFIGFPRHLGYHQVQSLHSQLGVGYNDSRFPGFPKFAFLLYAPLKVALQVFQLCYILLVRISIGHLLLVQVLSRYYRHLENS